MIWSLHNMYLLFYMWFWVLGVKIGASNELLWRKCRNCLLQQRDGLPVMHMGWLTFLSRVIGTLSWSWRGIFLSIVIRATGDEGNGWRAGWQSSPRCLASRHGSQRSFFSDRSVFDVVFSCGQRLTTVLGIWRN